MHKIVEAILILSIGTNPVYGKVVVFWQEGFPTLESQPVPQETLGKALDGLQPEFANLDELNKSETLRSADLLVLPYGSAAPRRRLGGGCKVSPGRWQSSGVGWASARHPGS
jgi:hypothetical protein